MSGYRFGCGKEITVYIPTRYDYKARKTTCGTTAYDGGVNQCRECEDKHNVPTPYEDEDDMAWYERATDGDECY